MYHYSQDKKQNDQHGYKNQNCHGLRLLRKSITASFPEHHSAYSYPAVSRYVHSCLYFWPAVHLLQKHWQSWQQSGSSQHLDVSVTGLHFHPFCPRKGIYILNESTSYNLFILSVILSIILDQCNIFYICDLPDLLCEIEIILPTEYLNCHLCFLPTHRL